MYWSCADVLCVRARGRKQREAACVRRRRQQTLRATTNR